MFPENRVKCTTENSHDVVIGQLVPQNCISVKVATLQVTH